MVFKLNLYELAHESYMLFSNGMQNYVHEIAPNFMMTHL